MKYKILDKLKEHSGKHLPGEWLSEILGIPVEAIKRHIKELKDEGYLINSSSKKGYNLSPTSDILNLYEIGFNLGTKTLGKNILCFDSIDSTNNYAKKIALEGCEDGTLVVTEEQTAGRGRLGRSWDSQNKKGIWMSVVLRPQISPEKLNIITIATSVAVTRAIKKVTGIDTRIKWPNDLIVDNRKVCGILTEMNSEVDRVNFVVVGIGINVNHTQNDFPQDIQEIATSLKLYSCRDGAAEGKLCPNFSRSTIIRQILIELEYMYNKINTADTKEFIDEWKNSSITMGREVLIISSTNQYTAIAKDITNDGKLVVESSDGQIKEVNSGEISIRGIMNYI